MCLLRWFIYNEFDGEIYIQFNGRLFKATVKKWNLYQHNIWNSNMKIWGKKLSYCNFRGIESWLFQRFELKSCWMLNFSSLILKILILVWRIFFLDLMGWYNMSFHDILLKEIFIIHKKWWFDFVFLQFSCWRNGNSWIWSHCHFCSHMEFSNK